ncbi:hypothetical protein SK128_017102 [Halocaridina rubra]|uniref:DUF4614 domain-containing protein n=1 Tax=Halocaridina rubra TaxID=373956 RepID=A0AAN8XDF2_HALRR
MDSDGDLEAYLNQLSKKTQKLCQDETHNSESNSSVISDVDISEEFNSKFKIGFTESAGQAADFNDKNVRVPTKQSSLYNELNHLENKYLKKSFKKVMARTEYPDVAPEDGSDKPSKGDKKSVRVLIKPSKIPISDESNESSVDDELLKYLKESSVMENCKESDAEDDKTDDILNFNNIMTVEDILGQITDIETDAESDRKELQISNDKENHGKFTSSNKSSTEFLPSQRKKSVLEGDTYSPFYSKAENTLETVVHPKSKMGNKEVCDKTEGLLFAQTSDGIFHASRRSSVMSPVFKRRTSTKSLLSESVHEAQDHTTDSNEVSEADELEVNVSHSIDDKIKESDIESVHEIIPSENSEDFVGIHASTCLEEIIFNQERKSKTLSKISENKKPSSTDGDGKLAKPMQQKTHPVDERQEIAHDHIVPSTSQSTKRGEELFEPSESHEERLKCGSERKSREKSTKSTKHKHKKVSRSSSTSSSSSDLSYSSCVKCNDFYSRLPRRHKHKGHNFNPWCSHSYMPPLWWMQFQPYFSPPGPETSFQMPSSQLLEGYLASSSSVGIKDILHQQVALTRQFMESQKTLYHAYSATLSSSYHYTSLRDTEKYIKQRKHPLTFDEAYRMVKEEMKESK